MVQDRSEWVETIAAAMARLIGDVPGAEKWLRRVIRSWQGSLDRQSPRPLPFSSDYTIDEGDYGRRRSLREKVVLVCAIHDARLPDADRINPFQNPGNDIPKLLQGVAYSNQVDQVARLIEDEVQKATVEGYFRAVEQAVRSACLPETAKTKASLPDVQKRLLRLRDEGLPYTSNRDLARRLNCSIGLISRAVNGSEVLKNWAKREAKGPPKVQGLNEVVMDRVPNRTAPDPTEVAEDDLPEEEVKRLINEMIEKAENNPGTQQELKKLEGEDRQKIARLYLEQQQDRYYQEDAPRGNIMFERK
ncbi:MAG: hypothetical protein GXY55_12340 [Phycisphaerae bacterium]|nr:hypothetical protein [Phycisphaerae bacterium]